VRFFGEKKPPDGGLDGGVETSGMRLAASYERCNQSDKRTTADDGGCNVVTFLFPNSIFETSGCFKPDNVATSS
jgi:hypothetical protein